MLALDIDKLIHQAITEVADIFKEDYNADIQIENHSATVFIKFTAEVTCPFGFRLNIYVDEDNKVSIIPSMFLVRSFASGDKTDIYVLFASCMGIIQKMIFGENIYIDYLNLFDNFEINSAFLLFSDKVKAFESDKTVMLKEYVKQSFSHFIMSLMVNGSYFGSFSNKQDEEKFDDKYYSYLCSNSNFYNCQARTEHQYYADSKRGITLLCLNNNHYEGNCFDHLNTEILDGIDGKIIYQNCGIDESKSLNFIPVERWCLVQEIITDMNIESYRLVCQDNALYLFEKQNIWVFDGDFNRYWVGEETLKIIERQNKEKEVLGLNQIFSWKHPIQPSRFEELIADLMERENLVQSVRLLGKSNCPDGGRDLLIWKVARMSEDSFSSELVIGQCKAYKRSVNKSNVRDIRDTIENYNAVGFHLYVSSAITSPLADSLVKLKEKYKSDWWTEREIFQRLRQNSDIADRYTDILEIFENERKVVTT